MKRLLLPFIFATALHAQFGAQPWKKSGGVISPKDPAATVSICASLPCTASLIAPNITTSLPPNTPGSLARFFDVSVKPMSQKVIVWFGNSTVQAANELFTQLATYAGSGQILDGLTVTPTNLDGNGWVVNIGNIYNKGNNGALLAGMLADSEVPNICALNPDLIILRTPLINDVRQGALTLDGARSLVRQMSDKFVACAPWADVIVTTENSLLTTDPGSHNWIVPSTAAQAYSTLMHDAVVPFAGAYPGWITYDLQSALFGLTAPATSTYMLNSLHPSTAGRIAEADLIAGTVMPAFKYRPIPQLPGVGTNLLEYSSDFAHWTGIGSPATTISSTSLTNAAANSSAIYANVAVTPGASYVYSFWAKAGTSANPRSAVYDVTNAGFIVASTPFISSINSTTWTRITVPFTAPATCTTARVYINPSDGVTGTGGGSVFVDHVLVNAGATALPWVKGSTQ